MPRDHTHSTSAAKPITPEDPTPDPRRLSDGQHVAHWILPEEDRLKGFVRPVRRTYVHERCGTPTSMPQAIAETYAANPSFYGSTFCCHCRDYYPVGETGQFRWEDGSKVGT